MAFKLKKIFLAGFCLILFTSGCGKGKGISVSISPGELFFNCTLTELKVFLSSKNQFSYEVLSHPDWLSISPSKGENVYSAVLTAYANVKNVSTITLEGSLQIGAGGKTYSIPVSYESCPGTIKFYPDVLNFGDDKVYLSLSLYSLSPSPVNWVARTSKDWVKVTPSSGTLYHSLEEITVSVDRSYVNPGSYQATVTFESEGGKANLTVYMSKATKPVLFFPEDEVSVEACKESVTIPVVNIGTGREPFTISACPPILYPEKNWTYTGEGAFAIPLSAARLGAEPGVHSCGVNIIGKDFSHTVPVRVNVSSFPGDYVKFTEITPPEGITNPSTEFSLSLTALTYIDSSSTGGYVRISAYKASGGLLKHENSTHIPSGLTRTVMGINLNGLTPSDWPIYIVLQLISDTGRGVPQTVLEYAIPDTFAVSILSYSFEDGWKSTSTPVLDFTLSYSAPVTASVEGVIFDEARNLLARWSSSRYGSGTVKIRLPFYAPACASYISIEGWIYDLSTGTPLARSARVVKRNIRYSDAPDEGELESVTSPFPLTSPVERNFHTGDEVDLFEVPVSAPGWYTFYVNSLLPSTDALEMIIWGEGFTTPLTFGKIYDPVYSSPFTVVYAPHPLTYSVSVSPAYSFRGSGTEYVLYTFPGKISTKILNFSASIEGDVLKYTASLSSSADLPRAGIGLYLNRSFPPSVTEMPDFYQVIRTQKDWSLSITFTLPCTFTSPLSSYLRLFAPDATIQDDVAGPVSVTCP